MMETMLQIGECYFGMQRYADAVAAFEEIIDAMTGKTALSADLSMPSHTAPVDVFYEYSRALYHNGEHEKVLQVIDRVWASSSSSMDIRLRVLHAITLVTLSRNDEALAELDTALREIEETTQLIQDAQRQTEHLILIFNAKAANYATQQRWAEAIRSVKQALLLMPGNVQSTFNLCWILFRLAEMDTTPWERLIHEAFMQWCECRHISSTESISYFKELIAKAQAARSPLANEPSIVVLSEKFSTDDKLWMDIEILRRHVEYIEPLMTVEEELEAF